MIFKNICSKKTYTTKQGEEKTVWPIVGTLKETDGGKQFIELNMFPGTDFFVFERKEKEQSPKNGKAAEPVDLSEEVPF
jgi:hypothetical protein